MFDNLDIWFPAAEECEGRYDFPIMHKQSLPEITEWIPFSTARQSMLNDKTGIHMYVHDYRMTGLWRYWAMKDLFPLTVISAEVKDDGTIRMRLSDGCHFTIIPWPDVDGEAWRIFRPKDNTSHLVYYGNGTIDG